MVDLLVDHGVDPNKADGNGFCPLLYRMLDTGPRKAISMELLAKGASPGGTNKNGTTPLHRVREADVAKLLIERGANVNAVDNQGGTPLHVAATRGSLDVAKVLIAAGAKNLRNKQNQLPIDLARSSSGNDPAGLTARAELLAELSRLLVPAIRCSRVPG